MGRWLALAFMVLTLAAGASLVWAPDSMVRFAYIVPIIFLFIAIGAFLLLLLHYADTLLSVTGRTYPIGALGLPDGSIRAFLTIGLLVLVAVFGTFIYFESGKVGNYTIVREDVPITSPAELDALRKSVGDRFIVIPKKGDKADVVAANPDNTRADIAKQLLTMIATVLTTVIGFYFGSGATASAQSKEGEPGGAAAPGGEVHPGGGTSGDGDPKTVADVKRRVDEIQKEAGTLIVAATATAEKMRTTDAAAADEATRQITAHQTTLDKSVADVNAAIERLADDAKPPINALVALAALIAAFRLLGVVSGGAPKETSS